MTSGLEMERPILISALHKFIAYLLTTTLTHWLKTGTEIKTLTRD